ncbi:predicted protein [Botrytis cinerea T4]|uniref:Uncharacterized protein n=1 Tax=Botryotinia fuckeliana (strain T4) TaxID=999810 RepID=G2XVF0_BOTF4|nr:predicted protein [Botrytis cinerea T4]
MSIKWQLERRMAMIYTAVPQFCEAIGENLHLANIQIFIGRRRDTRFQMWEKFDFRLAVHLSHRSFRHIKVPM